MLLERDEVLSHLAELAADARRSHGCLVLVSGEAGIGKTAVVSAFVDGLDAHTRLYWGTCDAVSPPRPFAPIADIAERSGGPLRDALVATDRDRVFEAFLSLIRHGEGRARVIVIEDLHWADDATIDLLRVIGSRLRSSPVLVIGTFRDHEVGPHHPLRIAIGDMPADVVVRLPVRALSTDAVAQLARGTLIDPVALHRVTAGNPFFVTEVIAAFGAEIPSSVQDAVAARVHRLSDPAQAVVAACAVLGPRSERDLLLELSGQPEAALEECLERGVLEVVDEEIAFRHEVARRSILDTIAQADRVRLNTGALALLRDRPDADPGRLARHATVAGDEGSILQYARTAGDRAASLGAHREAAEHYANALELAEALPPQEHAKLLESYAQEMSLLDEIDAACASQRRALGLWEQIEDPIGRSECLRGLALLEYLGGDSSRAMEVARQSVAILEPISPEQPEHARAYAVLAQRLMADGEDRDAIIYSARAQRIAEQFGDETTAVHALTTHGATSIYHGDEQGWHELGEAVARARASDLAEGVTRALINLVEAALDLWRLDVAERYGTESTAWFDDHELDLYRRLNASRMAELALRRGQWDEAAQIASELLSRETTARPIQARAFAMLATVAVRRGNADPWPMLERATAAVATERTLDLAMVRTSRTEAALGDGDLALALAEGKELMATVSRDWVDSAASEALFWAWRAGATDSLPDFVAEPFRLHSEGRYLDAARAWREIGCPYYEGLALADTNHAEHLLEALTIFHRLGAAPAAQGVTDQLRELGAAQIPRGPRSRTRRNPHGLTDRELEILEMLGASMSNAEIAQRLVLSPKTVDHHVTAILKKLNVHNRAAAGVLARSMNLKDGVTAAQDRESA